MTYNHTTFLFPGQGAQKVGMGKDFYDNFACAKHTFQEADSVLGFSLSKIIFEGPADQLTKTMVCQCGIFTMSVAVLRVVQQEFPALVPKVVAGLSLGEYTALVASGRLSFETCLPLVFARSSYMSEACDQIKGTMAALVGLTAEAVETMVSELNLTDDLWVANFNSPGQTVISGTCKGVKAGSEEAKKRGAKRVIPLAVHGAFHSGLMRLAEERLAPKVFATNLLPSEITLIMNVTGEEVSDEAQIKENMIKQVTHSVRWEQSIRSIQDVDLFIEMGPGKTLAGMNRKIGTGAETISIGEVKDLYQLSKVNA